MCPDKSIKLNRVMIAAMKSGSGKTMVTCALLQALKDRGQKAVACKCGPDYIDPMFHQKVIQVPSRNLDTFFTEEQTTRELLLKGRNQGDIAVLEGVMGLYDGLGGIREEGSSYHLAQVTHTPIILLVDAKGASRSIIPAIAGFLAYDHAHLIQGVILNRTSKACYQLLKPLLEKELHIKALGYLPQQKEFHIESRHLGLVTPLELKGIQEQLSTMSRQFADTVSVEAIMDIARTACPLALPEEHLPPLSHKSARIAVARDEAFCFYYEDNLRLLEEYGASLQYFSPLHDKRLPDGCSGLLLGGGYPELYARELSANISMLTSIQQAISQGMPAVAECGGFMYLHSAIRTPDGTLHLMADVIPAVCTYTGKLVRFGYIQIKEKQSRFLGENQSIKGHEFHYYDSPTNGDACFATKPVTNNTYSCIIEGENYWFGFPHLYYPSNPAFPRRFAEMAHNYAERNQETLYGAGDKNCSHRNHRGR